MSLIFMDGFESQDVGIKWSGFGAPNGYTSSTRFGVGSAVICSHGNGNNNGVLLKYISPVTQIFIGCAINFQGFQSGGVTILGDNGTTNHLSVDFAVNQIELRSGYFGGVIASAPGTYFTNTWYYLEVMATLATSGGTCQVRVNGVQVINFTGNTMNGGTSTNIDGVMVSSSATFGPNYYFDDLYVCSSSGATNNTFLGDVRVQTLLPNGVGSSTLLTPTGSANNWQNVNDIPDSASTYNASSTVGNRDTYTMTDVIASTGAVFGIQESMHAFKTDSGSANMKAALKSGATLVYDPTQVLGTANAWSAAIRETDPNTAVAWTPASVNAVEFGGEVA